MDSVALNVLGVFAHPDDEVLGCGGTLAKHVEAGNTVRLSFLCETRASAGVGRAAETLGITQPIPAWAFKDQELDMVPMKVLAEPKVGADFDPDVVYTHHPGDLNQDHARVAQSVLIGFRPKPGEKHRTILACEVLSSTEYTFPQAFSPNWFEQITYAQLDRKRKALACYPSELQKWPGPRTPEGVFNLARVRGQQIGVPLAEAFQLLRRSC